MQVLPKQYTNEGQLSMEEPYPSGYFELWRWIGDLYRERTCTLFEFSLHTCMGTDNKPEIYGNGQFSTVLSMHNYLVFVRLPWTVCSYENSV